ncbi:MAG: hypothetical protein PVJ33_15145 [Lysobacterales bacterium]
MKFAKIVFLVAGLYGFLTLIPLYFLETRIGLSNPPAISHPEYFYGFIGVALAWQVLFLVISRDPVRYVGAMPVAFLEKLTYGGATILLFGAHRVGMPVLATGLIDLFLGVMFLAARTATLKAAREPRSGFRVSERKN